VVRGDRRGGTRRRAVTKAGGGATFDKPVDNIGNKSIPNYAAYAAKHIYDVNIPGCGTPARVFVGQRKDPSSSTWARPSTWSTSRRRPPKFAANAKKAAKDDLADKNVTTPSRSKCRLPA
jgi:hypothetical protein